MTTQTSQFKNGQKLNVRMYGAGEVIGFVNSPHDLNGKQMLVRVQFISGQVRDFHPTKLAAKIIK